MFKIYGNEIHADIVKTTTDIFWQWFQFDSYPHSRREQRIKRRTSFSMRVTWNTNSQTHPVEVVWVRLAKMTANGKKKDGSLEIWMVHWQVWAHSRWLYSAAAVLSWPLPWRNVLIYFLEVTQNHPKKHQKTGTCLQSKMHRSISLNCFLFKSTTMAS